MSGARARRGDALESIAREVEADESRQVEKLGQEREGRANLVGREVHAGEGRAELGGEPAQRGETTREQRERSHGASSVADARGRAPQLLSDIGIAVERADVELLAEHRDLVTHGRREPRPSFCHAMANSLDLKKRSSCTPWSSTRGCASWATPPRTGPAARAVQTSWDYAHVVVQKSLV